MNVFKSRRKQLAPIYKRAFETLHFPSVKSVEDAIYRHHIKRFYKEWPHHVFVQMRHQPEIVTTVAQLYSAHYKKPYPIHLAKRWFWIVHGSTWFQDWKVFSHRYKKRASAHHDVRDWLVNAEDWTSVEDYSEDTPLFKKYLHRNLMGKIKRGEKLKPVWQEFLDQSSLKKP